MNIVVGVSGGIAAYKAVQLVRLLVKDSHDVHVVPTPDSLHFVGLATWEAISRNPVTTSVHDEVAAVRHVALGQAADLIVIAPATANTLAKLATGIADNLLGTTVLASTAPLLVAPAMHTQMWEHPATVANVATLTERGVGFVGPESGELTGGDNGAGRMAEPEQIHAAIASLLDAPARPRDLVGVNLLLSLGGTTEPIDPVRFLGNRSSGRQGVAIALAAARRGARVTAVCGATAEGVRAPLAAAGVVQVEVGTAAQLQAAMVERQPVADVVVMAAAVADYRVEQVSQAKLTKKPGADGRRTLELVTNPDILAGLVAEAPAGQVLVGFSAQTDEDDEVLLEAARAKRARKGVDLLAVNRVGWTKGFESSQNSIHLIGADDRVVGEHTGSKEQVADALLDEVVRLRQRAAGR